MGTTADVSQLTDVLPFSMARADQIPAGYSPVRQIAQTVALASFLLGVSATLAARAPLTAWLLLPAFWAFANVFEWTVHRFPMHRPLLPRIMYRNHAQIHHMAFPDGQMAIDDLSELSLVMMPWYTIVMLLVAASPVAIVAGLLGGLPLVGIFYFAALSYFLFYETVHALYHVPPELLARLGVNPAGNGQFARMRAHHARHHELRRMAHVNFNVTIPFADTLLGTRDRTPPGEAGVPDGEVPVDGAGGPGTAAGSGSSST